MKPRIALLIGTFHKKESELMKAAASALAQELGLEVTRIVEVPGSMEKPLALKWLLSREDVDGAAVLGIIERGETKHGLVMAHSVVRSIIDLQLQFGKPAGVGILGPEILPSQIPSRVEPYARAAVAAVARMLQVKQELK